MAQFIGPCRLKKKDFVGIIILFQWSRLYWIWPLSTFSTSFLNTFPYSLHSRHTHFFSASNMPSLSSFLCLEYLFPQLFIWLKASLRSQLQNFGQVFYDYSIESGPLSPSHSFLCHLFYFLQSIHHSWKLLFTHLFVLITCLSHTGMLSSVRAGTLPRVQNSIDAQ